MTTTFDAGSLCVYCGNDTAWGSGRFVNRIPGSVDAQDCDWLDAGTRESFDYVDGYACAECMSAR